MRFYFNLASAVSHILLENKEKEKCFTYYVTDILTI